jgi:hypothetical protein
MTGRLFRMRLCLGKVTDGSLRSILGSEYARLGDEYVLVP